MSLSQQPGKILHHLHVQTCKSYINLSPFVVLGGKNGSRIVHFWEKATLLGNFICNQKHLWFYGTIEDFPAQMQVVNYSPILSNNETTLLQTSNFQLTDKGKNSIVSSSRT